MDDFEKFYKNFMDLSQEGRDKEIERMNAECICTICPTYNQCAKEADELLFCIVGKSDECIKEEKGCMCPPCPFARRRGFGANYTTYCIRGPEAEQRRK